MIIIYMQHVTLNRLMVILTCHLTIFKNKTVQVFIKAGY
jgi:hypothetical protein